MQSLQLVLPPARLRNARDHHGRQQRQEFGPLEDWHLFCQLPPHLLPSSRRRNGRSVASEAFSEPMRHVSPSANALKPGGQGQDRTADLPLCRDRNLPRSGGGARLVKHGRRNAAHHQSGCRATSASSATCFKPKPSPAHARSCTLAATTATSTAGTSEHEFQVSSTAAAIMRDPRPRPRSAGSAMRWSRSTAPYWHLDNCREFREILGVVANRRALQQAGLGLPSRRTKRRDLPPAPRPAYSRRSRARPPQGLSHDSTTGRPGALATTLPAWKVPGNQRPPRQETVANPLHRQAA